MSDILLVHGSCHGAWCWHRLIPALAGLGHDARAIDLPGRDGLPTTLAEQAKAICTALDRPMLVLAHSAGGFAITAAAELDPGPFRALIYLCAYLPVSGQSLAEMRRAWPEQPLRPAIKVSPDRRSFAFDPAAGVDLLYDDCPAADRADALRLLCPEPIAPQETPLALTPRSQSLPRFYIRCTKDRAIPPGHQAQMAASMPKDHRFDLPTSHSPFLAAPDLLAVQIDRIARSLDPFTAPRPDARPSS